MATAFAILLFVLVYGRVAYIVYDDSTGGRSRLRPRLELSSGQRGVHRVQLRSRYQH